MSAAAKRYVDRALALMHEHSVRAAAIEWSTLRQHTYELAAGAKTPADTYQAIEVALADLGDHHSTLVPPPASDDADRPGAQPVGVLLGDQIGEITVPATSALGVEGDGYSQRAQDLIRALSRRGACRWIVDLRTNTGGDMWPMLAGLAPLLSKGTVGYFVVPGGDRVPWTVTPRSAGQNGKATASVTSPVAVPSVPPVAVLTGPLTASSGEAVVIAFRGQRESRSFGAATDGVPSANYDYRLSDGARLLLTAAYDADRTGHSYPITTPLQPDEITSSGDTHRSDQAPKTDVTAATRWLSTMPCTR